MSLLWEILGKMSWIRQGLFLVSPARVRAKVGENEIFRSADFSPPDHWMNVADWSSSKALEVSAVLRDPRTGTRNLFRREVLCARDFLGNPNALAAVEDAAD